MITGTDVDLYNDLSRREAVARERAEKAEARVAELEKALRSHPCAHLRCVPGTPCWVHTLVGGIAGAHLQRRNETKASEMCEIENVVTAWAHGIHSDAGALTVIRDLVSRVDKPLPREAEPAEPVSEEALNGLATECAWYAGEMVGYGLDVAVIPWFRGMLDKARDLERKAWGTRPPLREGSRVLLRASLAVGTLVRRSESDPRAWHIAWPDGSCTHDREGALVPAPE